MGYLVRISFLGYNLKSYPDYHKISYNILSYPIISYHILSYPKISSGANSQMGIHVVYTMYLLFWIVIYPVYAGYILFPNEYTKYIPVYRFVLYINLGIYQVYTLNIQIWSVGDVSRPGPSVMAGMLGRRTHTAYSAFKSVLLDMPAGGARESLHERSSEK